MVFLVRVLVARGLVMRALAEGSGTGCSCAVDGMLSSVSHCIDGVYMGSVDL